MKRSNIKRIFILEKQKVFKLYSININMFGWFFGKKGIKKIEKETKKGFDSVKKDIGDISKWIKYLNEQNKQQKNKIFELKEILSTVNEELEGVKNIISILGIKDKNLLSKQLSNKQTAVQPVQTAVQTAVQTPTFDNFSITERALLFTLLNTDMKLSYGDLSMMLGKERSTIRSQINGIKQKMSGLITEIIEKNGKKRVFISDNVKEKILKTIKVRVKKT